MERFRITDGGQVRIGNSTITASNSADDLIIGLDSPGGDRGNYYLKTSGTEIFTLVIPIPVDSVIEWELLSMVTLETLWDFPLLEIMKDFA